MATIAEVFDLQGEGTKWHAPMVPSQIARTFGGQVVAQCFAAATRTVEDKVANSLHGYFVGPGDSTKGMELVVDKLRDGGSFSHREVRGYQDERLIFVLNASFHRKGDQGPEHYDEMPQVPSPDELEGIDGTTPDSTRIFLQEWAEWDVRLVPQERSPESEANGSGYTHIWFRNTSEVPDDEHYHQSALTYLSDMTLLHSTLIDHPGHKVQMASLDHSVWFFKPVRVDEWLLYEQTSPAAGQGVALAQGKVFNREGQLVALVMQQGLTRNLREDIGGNSKNGNW